MALNAEPAEAVERQENHLPPKSYADAAEEALDQDGNESMDEAAINSIKETPPRKQHARIPSESRPSTEVYEPRPLGEVMEEEEHERYLPSPGSPPLRHVSGRLEQNAARETYADAVKEPEPVTPRANGARNGAPVFGNGGGVKVSTDDNAMESYSGVGSDESPRSPVRKAHKRVSSRSLHAAATKHASQQSPNVDGKMNSPQEEGEQSPEVVFEKYRSRSGHNLASVELEDDLNNSLEQRENKQYTSEPKPPSKRPKQSGELVSGRRAGAGWSQSAIRWAPLNVPFQRRLQTLMVLIHTLSIAGGLALFFLLCTIPLLWPILLPYLIYVLLSNAGTSGQLSHRSDWIRRMKIWSLFAGYFPARLHRTTTLEPTRKYIFGYHPHGIISHGAFAAFATEALGFSQLFPGITNTLLTLDSNFRIPLYRDYALRLGLASVSRESCENILSKGGRNGEGMGRAITIVVGGARESLDATPGSLKLVLKRRKGFVKLAIRCGADLVPVLAFGENDLYDQVDSNSHPYVHKAQLLVKKFMGFTVPLFHARGKIFTRHNIFKY